jgi:starch synthase
MRANVFGYADDHVRFALMSKALLEWLKQMRAAFEKKEDGAWWPDIIHCHDWHASYCIDLARRDKRYKSLLSDTPVVLTVHNFKYQGNGDVRYVPEADLDDGKGPLEPLNSKRLLKQNPLKRGLLYSDAVTTVSPTHAREVLTPEYAEGLDDTVLKIAGKLSGILNGIDTDDFNPFTDPTIKQRYSRWRFASARAANKKHLQREFSLPTDPDAFLLAYVGRLSSQKGLDLLVEALPQLLTERKNIQFVAVGGGDDRHRAGLESLKQTFPEQVGLYLLPDFRLPRKLFSGADAMLIPSLFEPGGIVALEALRYGAVPIVRRTGGLNDSIEEFDPAEKKGNGFSFTDKTTWSLFGAIITALTIFRQPPLWERLVSNALSCDFSWDPPAKEYEAWYRQTSSELRRGNRTGG